MMPNTRSILVCCVACAIGAAGCGLLSDDEVDSEDRRADIDVDRSFEKSPRQVTPGSEFTYHFVSDVQEEYSEDQCSCGNLCVPAPPQFCISTKLTSVSSLEAGPADQLEQVSDPIDDDVHAGRFIDFRAKAPGRFEIDGEFDVRVNGTGGNNHTETVSETVEGAVARPDDLQKFDAHPVCETEGERRAVPYRAAGDEPDLHVMAELRANGEEVWGDDRWLEDHLETELFEIPRDDVTLVDRTTGDSLAPGATYVYEFDAESPPQQLTVRSPLDPELEETLEVFTAGRFDRLEVETTEEPGAPRPTKGLTVQTYEGETAVTCGDLVQYRLEVEPTDTCGLSEAPGGGTYHTSLESRRSTLYVSGWGDEPCEVTVEAPEIDGGNGQTQRVTVDWSD